MTDITLQNFQQELIDASQAQPVLLDIWAPWCGPCKALGPALERLETEYAGRFVLAKLNADEVPELAGQLSQMFGVRSIPFCVLFANGAPVDGFVGALPDAEIRSFLDRHLPSADAVAAAADVDAAAAMLAAGDADLDAIVAKLREALALDAANDAARADLIDLLAQHDRVADARALFNEVAPQLAQPITLSAEQTRIAALGHWLDALEALPRLADEAALTAALDANPRDFDARFALAQRHFAQGDLDAALDALLEIVIRDKNWRDQLPRKTFVAILELETPAKPKAAPTAAAASGPGGLIDTGHVAKAADPQSDWVAGWRRKLAMALN